MRLAMYSGESDGTTPTRTHWPARCAGDNFLTISVARGFRRIGAGLEIAVGVSDEVGVGFAEDGFEVSERVGDDVTVADGSSSGWEP